MCSNKKRVISFIEDKEIIKKILKHLNLWDRKARPPAKMKHSSQEARIFIDYSESQLPPSYDYLYFDVYYPEVSSGEF
jgi:hypothetical protein